MYSTYMFMLLVCMYILHNSSLPPSLLFQAAQLSYATDIHVYVLLHIYVHTYTHTYIHSSAYVIIYIF